MLVVYVHDSFIEADKRVAHSEIEKLAFDEHYIRNQVRERPNSALQKKDDSDDGFGLNGRHFV